MLLAAGAVSVLPTWSEGEPKFIFAHPGMLQCAADLERMRNAVKSQSEPIFSGFQQLSGQPGSKRTYSKSGAFEEIGRNPNAHSGDFDRDSNAAYQCAVMWTITGDRAYAGLAIDIVNDWSAKLKKISGLDAVLCASLGGFKIVNAAELLKHTGTGWAPADAERFSQLMRSVFLPVIQEFAPFANGNWDTAAIKLMMAIAIYDDDAELFARAITYYRHGCGDGRLTHYIYVNGQCQESGRDQQHTQLGLAHMGDACEMAWHQGLDLYAELDSRLLAGFEYTAKYELGETVPFIPDVDQTGKYRHTVISERSPLRTVFEQIYNHYVNRMGMPAPWTTKAAAKVRPEGPPFGADATGYGTLLYTRAPGPDPMPSDSPAQKTVVYAQGDQRGVMVDFVALRGCRQYDILRANHPDGPFQTIASGVRETSFLDTTATAGQLYFYRVHGAVGVESAALPQMRGLPSGWQQHQVGQLTGPTAASCSGSSFRLSAAGGRQVEQGGAFFAVDHAMASMDGLSVRLSPLVASSFVSVGLVVRSANAEVLLAVSPRGGDKEHPAWSALFLHRTDHVDLLGTQPLDAPIITYGRIRQPLWLRIVQESGKLHAACSADGAKWTEIGKANAPSGELRIGMFVSSGIEEVATDVLFEEVSLQVKR
jgi:hypothetical protein